MSTMQCKLARIKPTQFALQNTRPKKDEKFQHTYFFVKTESLPSNCAQSKYYYSFFVILKRHSFSNSIEVRTFSYKNKPLEKTFFLNK
jgi:hypothetical protein